MSRQSIRRFTTWIINNLIDKNIFFCKCTSKEVIYYKPIVLPIQYKLIERVDCKDWPRKFDKSDNKW